MHACRNMHTYIYAINVNIILLNPPINLKKNGMFVITYPFMCTQMCMCMCTYMHVCIYIYIHIVLYNYDCIKIRKGIYTYI